jgi:hypothetical protein
MSPFSQICIKHPASRAGRVLAWTFSDKVPYVRHQHVTAEPDEQRLFAILAAARIVGTMRFAIRRALAL